MSRHLPLVASALRRHFHRPRFGRRPTRWCPLLLVGALGCGPQKEGERCDLANASEDCEAGLVCVSAAQLGLDGELDSALCCPQSEAQITRSECGAGASLPAELVPSGAGGGSMEEPDPAPSVDGGVLPTKPAPAPDAPAPDAAAPSSSELPDASSDGPGSRPADGGTTAGDASAPQSDAG